MLNHVSLLLHSPTQQKPTITRRRSHEPLIFSTVARVCKKVEWLRYQVFTDKPPGDVICPMICSKTSNKTNLGKPSFKKSAVFLNIVQTGGGGVGQTHVQKLCQKLSCVLEVIYIPDNCRDRRLRTFVKIPSKKFTT